MKGERISRGSEKEAHSMLVGSRFIYRGTRYCSGSKRSSSNRFYYRGSLFAVLSRDYIECRTQDAAREAVAAEMWRWWRSLVEQRRRNDF